MTAARPRIAVVGGGIAGIAAALDLLDHAEITLFEASDRLGGPVQTVDFAGARVEAGPDSFLARRPEMIDLAERLGFGDALIAPTVTEAGIWSYDAVRTMPAGLVLGVPRTLDGLAASGIISPEGLERAAREPALAATDVGDDIGMGDLVERRYGREVFERLVDPLMGGVHAGRSELLSTEVAAPQLLAAARNGSLMQSLPDPPPSSDPVFLTVASGLGDLIGAATNALAGATVKTNSPVRELRVVGNAWEVDGEPFDGVVLATHASATAALLDGICAEASRALSTVTYASVVLTLMAYPTNALPKPFRLSGYLVPRVERKLTSAISWWNAKWAQRAPAGTEVVRLSTGRIDDVRHRALADDELVERLHAELVEATGLRADAPTAALVNRYEESLPQFRVNHLREVAAPAHAAAANAPAPLALAGSCYEGLGLPACVASGRAAAKSVLSRFSG